MAILRVDCGADGRADLRGFAAFAAPADGPTVLMIHGFKYDPAHPCASPHRSLFRAGPVAAAESRRGRLVSWPHGLGLDGGRGLAVACGWAARAGVLDGWLSAGRNGFARVYEAAAAAGAALVPALEAAARTRPQPVDVIAHSLGARVALALIRAAAEERRTDLLERLGRVILLGPAEFAAEARAALAACDRAGAQTPEVYALTARGNAPFDRAFELLGPWGRGPSLGRGGFGARRRGWIDLAFDHPGFAAFAAARGVALAPAGRGPCHWSFYARGGAFALHRAILERAPGWEAEALRAGGAPLLAPPAPAFGRRAVPSLAAEPA